MDEHVVELIQREIDGVNTIDEKRELETALSRDSDSKRLLDDLRATVGRLDRLQIHEAPSDMRDAIMASLPAERYRMAAPSPVLSWIRDFAASLQARPALAYAMTFVVGLLVGVAALELRDGSSVAPDAARGTVAGADQHEIAVNATDIVVRFGESSASVVRRSTGAVLGTFEFESIDDVELSVEVGQESGEAVLVVSTGGSNQEEILLSPER